MPLAESISVFLKGFLIEQRVPDKRLPSLPLCEAIKVALMVFLIGVIKEVAPLLPEATHHPIQHLRLGFVAEDVLLKTKPGEDK